MPSETSRYNPKPCAKCTRPFTPNGPRATTCKLDDCESHASALGDPPTDRLEAAQVRSAEAKAEHDELVLRARSRDLAQNAPLAARAADIVADAVATTPAKNGHAEEATALSALDVIDTFDLGYNLGNVVRFVLEKDDGDEMENLRSAHTYLERAIAKLEAAAP